MALMTMEEFRAHHAAQRPGKTCSICKQQYSSHGERYYIDRVQVCDGCYFGQLGEAMEAHPIVSPRRGHGTAT